MSIAPARKTELMKEYAVSANDTGSPQVQIAVLSHRIKHLTEHFKINKKDHHSRRGMLKLVATRRKLLDYLKERNRAGYEEIVKKLGLRG